MFEKFCPIDPPLNGADEIPPPKSLSVGSAVSNLNNIIFIIVTEGMVYQVRMQELEQ